MIEWSRAWCAGAYYHGVNCYGGRRCYHKKRFGVLDRTQSQSTSRVLNSYIITHDILEIQTSSTYSNWNMYKQDSKELSPRSLDKILLKLQVNSQNVQNTQLLQFIWFSNMSKLVQIQYDTNCYDSQTCLNMFKHVKTCSDSIWYELLRFSNMSEHV